MILIYPQGNRKTLESLQKALEGFSVGVLEPADLSLPLKELVKKDFSDPAFFESSNPEGVSFLYFSGVPVEEIWHLREALEKSKEPLPLMSVETPSNRKMTLENLMEEVSREAAYFEKRRQLMEKLEKADRKKMKENSDYFRCCMMAAALLEEEELSETMLDTALQVLSSFENPA